MDVRMDAPRPDVQTTEIPPIKEQMKTWATQGDAALHQPEDIVGRRLGRTFLTHIDEHIPLAVARRSPEDETKADDGDDAEPTQEQGVDERLEELWDGGCSRRRWAVERNDDGANDAQGAADLAEEGEFFLEEDGGEDGTAGGWDQREAQE